MSGLGSAGVLGLGLGCRGRWVGVKFSKNRFEYAKSGSVCSSPCPTHFPDL